MMNCILNCPFFMSGRVMADDSMPLDLVHFIILARHIIKAMDFTVLLLRFTEKQV